MINEINEDDLKEMDWRLIDTLAYSDELSEQDCLLLAKYGIAKTRFTLLKKENVSEELIRFCATFLEEDYNIEVIVSLPQTPVDVLIYIHQNFKGNRYKIWNSIFTNPRVPDSAIADSNIVIEDLELSNRTRNVLRRENIQDLRNLYFRRDYLLNEKIRGLGKNSVEEILKVLQNFFPKDLI